VLRLATNVVREALKNGIVLYYTGGELPVKSFGERVVTILNY